MAYVKTNWVDNTTPIDKNNLNKIEKGIYDNSLITEAIADKLNPTDTETYKTAELTEGQITDVIGVNDIIIKGQTEQDGTPTPSAPVDVNVVSGSNVINTSNKNLLDLTNYKTTTQNGITLTPVFESNRLLYIQSSGTYSSNQYFSLTNDLKLKPNTTYSLSGAYSTSARLRLREYNSNSTQLSEYFDTGSGITFTSNANVDYANIQIVFYAQNNVKFYPMLEQNSTATTYEPHQGKELPLDLGSIELCKIGDYQDYFYKSGSKWYLHKKIEKLILDGTENFNNTYTAFGLEGIKKSIESVGGLCNYYLYDNRNSGMANLPNNYFAIQTFYDDTPSKVFFQNTAFTTVTDFKADLAQKYENGKPVTLYYPSGTETNTEITDTTLISQLEAIYNAPLYEETNITQTNNDLPMILDITACKDNINGIKAFIRK